jgi:hypothetical protein
MGLPNAAYTLSTAPGDITTPTLMYSTVDTETPNNNPELAVTFSDQPGNWTGSMTVSNGFMYGQTGPAYVPLSRIGTGPKPANFTLSNVTFGGITSGSTNLQRAALSSYFASGLDSETCLNATSPAQWAAMTVAQVKAAHNACLLPVSGGALDGHSAFKNVSGAAQWNDGSGLTP